MGIRDIIWPRSVRTAVDSQPTEVREAVGMIVSPTRANRAQWPRRSIDTYASSYEKLALIFRCVGVIAAAVGSAPLKIYAESPDGGRVAEPAHPLRQLMVRPNPTMRESRFSSMVAMIAATTGFCVIEKERSAGSRVIGLWPLRSDWLKPIPRTAAPPDWEYRIPGYANAITLPATDVVVYTFADRPDMSPYGIGPLEACLREYGLLNTMTDFLKAFFDGGAMPVYGLVPDLTNGQTMDQAKADQLKEKWVRRHAGLDRAAEPAILAGIKDVKRLSFDFDELALNDLRDISDLAICQAFGVPPGLVGVRFGIERNTFSNATEMRRSFYEDTITPLWSRMDDTFTLSLLPEFDQRPNIAIEFDTSDIPALQEDRNAKAAWLTTAYLGGGLSAHTYHEELNLPKPAGEDFYLRGLATDAIPASDPLGQKAKADEQKRLDAAQKKAEAQLQQQQQNPDPSQDPNIDANPDATGDQTQRAALFSPEEYRALRATIGPKEMRAVIGTANRKTYLRIAERMRPSLSRYFDGQGKRVIAAVLDERRGGTGPVEVRELAAINWLQEDADLAKELNKLYLLTGNAAADAATAQTGVGLSFDLANPWTRGVMRGLAQRVVGIADESRTQIQDIVTNGLNEGKSLDEIAAQLQTTFDGWSESRALTIARTESQVSYNRASAAGYRESGVVDRAELLDNPDHDADPGSDGLTCAQRNGLVVALDDVDKHIDAEHPRGTLAIAPVLTSGE